MEKISYIILVLLIFVTRNILHYYFDVYSNEMRKLQKSLWKIYFQMFLNILNIISFLILIFLIFYLFLFGGFIASNDAVIIIEIQGILE